MEIGKALMPHARVRLPPSRAPRPSSQKPQMIHYLDGWMAGRKKTREMEGARARSDGIGCLLSNYGGDVMTTTSGERESEGSCRRQ